MALQEPAGLGTSPMTQKTSPPVGNKKQKVEKMPKRGAAPKVVDPRDEVMKLVAKKLKQDKTSVGIASPTAPMPTEIPAPMTTALAAPQVPAKKVEEDQLLSPTPIMAAKGKSIEGGDKVKKEGKGLAVVIDMGSPDKPEYEEASMGTPSDPPPGATGDEVKDNQHVLLSEGELVVPANVVRYHGLGMYEGLRRDALQGLGEMEDAGQVEYIDNDIKTAAAGMTIMNAQPNVATLGGIQKQQAVYNPALGQYGTAKAPEAASAKFVNTSAGGKFTDTNKDGIDDKLQPSINKGIASPVSTGAITPAALNLGPTTNPNTVVGAGNVGSYVANQSGIPGSGEDTTPPVVETPQAPLVRRPVQQEENNDNPVETEQEKAARALANDKINKAKELGYTYSPMKQIAMALLPLGFLGVNQKVGTVTLAGNVVGNDGREYDPLTGKVASSGSMLTDISNKLQGKDISNIGPGGEIVPDTKDPIGFTPMTAAGLTQYTIEEMRAAIGEQELINGVNTELANLQKENTTSLVAPSVSNLKVNSLEELTQKITDMALPYEESVGGRGTLSQAQKEAVEKSKEVALGGSKDDEYYSGYTGSFKGPSFTKEEAEFLSGARDTISAIDPKEREVFASETQKARDEAFREEAEAKSRKEARDAQMRGIGLGLSAAASAPGTSTNDALQGKGYSSYDSQGNPSGAAPAGSQYSATGTFSTNSAEEDRRDRMEDRFTDTTPTSDDTDSSSDESSGSAAGKGGSQAGVQGKGGSSKSTANMSYADDAQSSGSGGGGGGCVIATHGLSTGGFTVMEKAKAELWCQKTYHGKWYGEAFRRGYKAAGMKHVNAGTAPSVYQEFKDFVAYGRGIKKGWKAGLNYYFRTISFFITGLFIK